MKREGFLNKKAMNFQRRRQLGIITKKVKVKKEVLWAGLLVS